MARTRWQAVHKAAQVLGCAFENAFIRVVCRLLAAIYHLGCAGAIQPLKNPSPAPSLRNSTSSSRFINNEAAKRAAHLLGCPSVEHLSNEIFETKDSMDEADGADSQPLSNLELLGGFVANLYAIASNTLRDLINK